MGQRAAEGDQPAMSTKLRGIHQIATEVANGIRELAVFQVKLVRIILFNAIIRNFTYKIRNKPFTETGYYRKQEHFIGTLTQ